MRRRRFLRGLGGALAWPGLPRAETKSPRRIAFLSGFSSAAAAWIVDDLRIEMGQRGWVDGRDIVLLPPRAAEGRSARLPALAAEVLQQKPDVVLVSTAAATAAMKQATTTIPIVMDSVGDPIEYGLVASLRHPGANVTGSAYLLVEVAQKLLQIMKDAVPQLTAVAVLTNPDNVGAPGYWRAATTAAPALGIKVQNIPLRNAEELDTALAAIRDARLDGILVPPEPVIRSLRPGIAVFALRARLPVMVHGPAEILSSGELLAGGPSRKGQIQILATYVDKILRGAEPREMPITQPTSFELGVNLRTAAALGLTIPASILVRADRVIED